MAKMFYLKKLQFCKVSFSSGLISLSAERLHEFKFPGKVLSLLNFSTTRSDTVVGLEPGTSREQGKLLQHWPCGPVAHYTVCEAARSSSIGQEFFSPVTLCMRFCNSHVNGYTTFIKPSYSHILLLSLLCMYIIYSTIYSKSHFLMSSGFLVS